ERLLSRTGAERATPGQRTALQEIARGMDQAAKHNDDMAFMRLDRELNALLIAAAHNDYAARSMKLLQGLSRRVFYMNYRVVGALPLCAASPPNHGPAIAQSGAGAEAPAGGNLVGFVATFYPPTGFAGARTKSA